MSSKHTGGCDRPLGELATSTSRHTCGQGHIGPSGPSQMSPDEPNRITHVTNLALQETNHFLSHYILIWLVTQPWLTETTSISGGCGRPTWKGGCPSLLFFWPILGPLGCKQISTDKWSGVEALFLPRAHAHSKE